MKKLEIKSILLNFSYDTLHPVCDMKYAYMVKH